MTLSYETLIVEEEAKIGIVTINRPKQLNALNGKVYSELYKALKELEVSAKAIIITGSGGKAFVAGADIAEMKDMTAQEARKFALLGKNIGQIIEAMDLPVIAAINGFALGGGCELAMSCDLLIASENAIFGQPEINIGIIPGNGGTQRLPRLIGLARAKELIFLGGQIDANRALEIGLINKVVPSGEVLLDEAKRWALKLAQKASGALALAKNSMNRGVEIDLNTALDYEISCFAQCFTTEDQKEGTTAFLERRKPVFKGQ